MERDESATLREGLQDSRGGVAGKPGVGPLVRPKRWWKEQPEVEAVAVLAMSVAPR
jgi:hypothetical protein